MLCFIFILTNTCKARYNFFDLITVRKNTMNHIHLFYLLFLALNFSGKPFPKKTEPSITADAKTKIHSVYEDDEFIPWTFTRRLDWDDFLCEPKRNSDAVASTSTSLGIAYQVEHGQLTFTITCNFSKHKSWGLLKTDYILAHEQGHFDITEIYARKLYQALSQYEFSRKTYRKDVNEIYRSIVQEKENMQAAYDSESDHSRNRRLQYEWLEKIDLLLDETTPYAEYP